MKSVGKIQPVQTVDQMNFLTSAIKDKMKAKYQKEVVEMVEPKLRRSTLNKSTHDLTPNGFEKRKSVGMTSTQYFKGPADLREKSGKKTKIGQGLFTRRTQSGASNNFLSNNSRSHNLLPTYDESLEEEERDGSQLTRDNSRGLSNFNIPNLNLSTSMKSLS